MDTRIVARTSRRISPLRRLAALALAGGLLAGCGSSGQAKDQQSESPSPPMTSMPSAPSSSGSPMPSGPACGSVWNSGAKLPVAYKGCVQSGAWVAADNLGCSSGQKLVRFDDHFWAVRGGTIHRATSLKTDKAYQHSVMSCRA